MDREKKRPWIIEAAAAATKNGKVGNIAILLRRRSGGQKSSKYSMFSQQKLHPKGRLLRGRNFITKILPFYEYCLLVNLPRERLRII